MKKALVLFIAFSISAFARYDTLDFSKNTTQFKMINNSNSLITVDTIKIYGISASTTDRFLLPDISLLVFDTLRWQNPDYYWNWQSAPYRYHGGQRGWNDSGTYTFDRQASFRINKKDTLIIREAGGVAEYVKTLNKKDLITVFMKLVFMRSDKKNDTVITNLTWTKTGLIKATQKQLSIENNEIPSEYLVNGKKISAPIHTDLLILRKNRSIWNPR